MFELKEQIASSYLIYNTELTDTIIINMQPE